MINFVVYFFYATSQMMVPNLEQQCTIWSPAQPSKMKAKHHLSIILLEKQIVMILLGNKSKKPTKVDKEEEVKLCQQKAYALSSDVLKKNPKSIKFVKAFERKNENHTYLRCWILGTIHLWGTLTILGIPVVPDVCKTYAKVSFWPASMYPASDVFTLVWSGQMVNPGCELSTVVKGSHLLFMLPTSELKSVLLELIWKRVKPICSMAEELW